MSKEGYFSYASPSDLESLNEYASSAWGGGVSISRFDAIPKVPFQRSLEEGLSLFSSPSHTGASSRNPVLELINTKRQLIESKRKEVEAKKGELNSTAKSGGAAPGFLFDLQRQIEDSEREIIDLEEDIERRTKLYKQSIGEECDGEPIFDLTGSKFWTDYNKTFWHPSCLNVLSSLRHDSPVDIYNGEKFSTKEREDYLDRLRLTFEDCDHLEGLQMFVDADTIFGPLAVELLDDIRDDLGKVQNMIFPLFSSGGASIGQTDLDTRRIRSINRAITLSALRSSSSLILPLDSTIWRSKISFPVLDTLDLSNLYHTSAIIASTIDSLTLPFRAQENGLTWRQYIDSLVPSSSANFGLVSTCIPMPLTSTNNLSQQFFGYDIFGDPQLRTDEEKASAAKKKILPHATWMTSMLPLSRGENIQHEDGNTMQSTDKGVALPWSESVVLRGCEPRFAFNPADASYGAPSILYQYLKKYPCASRSFAAQQAASALPISYPKFFDKNFEFSRQMPTMTHVQVTRRLSDYFDIVATNTDYEVASRYPTLGFEREMVLAAQDAILTLQEDYSS